MTDARDIAALREIPPVGHPLQKLGALLSDLLDENHWPSAEDLLFEAYESLRAELVEKEGKYYSLLNDYQALESESKQQIQQLQAEVERLKNLDVVSVGDLLDAFEEVGIDTTGWDGDEDAAWIIAHRVSYLINKQSEVVK